MNQPVKLPLAASSKLRQLTALAEQAQTLARTAATAAIDDAAIRLARAQAEVDRLDPRHPAHAAATADVEHWTAERQRLLAERAALQAKGAHHGHLVAALKGWHRRLPPHVNLEPVPPPAITPNPGESLPDAIDRIRAEIAEHQRELQMLKAAPPPLDELKQQAADVVDALLAQGKPALKLKPGGDLEVSWRTRTSNGFFATPADVACLLAWLDRDAVIAALHRELAAIAPREESPPQLVRRGPPSLSGRWSSWNAKRSS